jgi:hypothetical protein
MNLLHDDNRFVRECLAHIPYNLRMKIMREYELIWEDAKTYAGNENSGRREANKFLLGKVNEFTGDKL